MSIIIKGMKMPTNCWDCPCINGENGYCQLRKEYVYGEIPRSCPIVPVPPHGRLIDESDVMKSAEEIRKSPWYNYKPYYSIRKDGFEMAIDMAVKDAPTIIEAEGERE